MNTLKHITTCNFCNMFCSNVKIVILVLKYVVIGNCFALKMSFKFFFKGYLFNTLMND